MTPMTPAQISDVLAKHLLWRKGDPSGARADLARANLARANLEGANLEGANLEGAYLEGANLAGANLEGANLEGAYLEGANLEGANLEGANLAGANLAGANLAGAYLEGANLAGANLEGANLAGANLEGAYLAGANLEGAYLEGANLAGANLAGANLEGAYLAGAYARATSDADRAKRQAERAAAYRERHPEVPVVEALDRKILDAITIGGGTLSMATWHTCETTHCRAGWAIHLAGEAGKQLEKQHGSQRAGALIYRVSTGRMPHFFASDERALEDIRRCAEQSQEGVEE